MAKIYRIVSQLSWVLGLLSIVAAGVIKVFRLIGDANVTPHTLFLIACAFFLCTLATREIART